MVKEEELSWVSVQGGKKMNDFQRLTNVVKVIERGRKVECVRKMIKN